MKDRIAQAFRVAAAPISSLLARISADRRAAFIRSYKFPPGLGAKLKEHHPDWEDAALGCVLAGLRDFMLLCLDARGGSVAMPSKAVDAAWHEFILFTRGYHEFCAKAFGYYLHHSPAESGRQDFDGLCRAWLLTCIRQGIDRKNPGELPALFAVDRDLEIPDRADFTPASLAGLPLPSDYIETGPGRYRRLGPKRLKRRKDINHFNPNHVSIVGANCAAGTLSSVDSARVGGFGHGGGHHHGGGCSGGHGGGHGGCSGGASGCGGGGGCSGGS